MMIETRQVDRKIATIDRRLGVVKAERQALKAHPYETPGRNAQRARTLDLLETQLRAQRAALVAAKNVSASAKIGASRRKSVKTPS